MSESRLTSVADLPIPDEKRVAGHSFRRLGAQVLITNDGGRTAVLSEADYRRYLKGEIKDPDPLAKTLVEGGFFRDQLDFSFLARETAGRRLLQWKGPNVHTIVVTLRCNFKCLYCHASVVGEGRTDMDMTLDTAKATVDLIFQSPSPTLMIEFQGGEPLLNWPVVKFIVLYAKKKNELAKRALHFGLISNFSLLDDEKMEFLAKEGVSFCTSLDGPEALHNKNRLFLGGNSHSHVLAGLRKVMELKKAGAKIDTPNAICTISRFSLSQPKAIVDEFLNLGLERVQLGPLDPIGFAVKSWDKIGYTSQEFVRFYAQALDYVIEQSRAGKKVYEKMAMIFLVRILTGSHWRFPNADGLCRLAYNHDGAVYASEEGRLLANEGDEFFKIGRVGESSLTDLLDHPTVRAGLLAASGENQPQCFQCAYQPYCTVLPVYNYQTQDSLWGQMPTNGWCEKMMGIFDVIFERLQKPESKKVLESWLDYKDR